MKKTIIFDLDGTLVDVIPVFFTIVNILARKFHFAPIAPEQVPELRRLHLKHFLWQQLGWRLVFLPLILKHGRDLYHDRAPDVPLFPGIATLLTTLHDHGYILGIVSSSREDTIRTIVKRHALPITFVASGKLFNKARSLSDTIKREGLLLSETLYIGDEVRDIEACQKIGLDMIAVTWGLNSKESLKKTGASTVDTNEALLKKILSA